LFAAESFEDLSNEVVAQLDGECSSRTVTASSPEGESFKLTY